MEPAAFATPDGRPVAAVTAAEMAEVDRVAEEVGLELLMMMEHAGRGLAETVHHVASKDPVVVLAGGGGNGGGGLCAARHLANHGRDVAVVLDREPAALSGAAARQWAVLGGEAVDRSADPADAIGGAAATVDALVGYRLEGTPRGRVEELVQLVAARADRVVSLDVPTGVDATTGERPGVAVEPDLTATLALPKTGLSAVDGELRLADLGIPAGVFEQAGLAVASPFRAGEWLMELETSA